MSTYRTIAPRGEQIYEPIYSFVLRGGYQQAGCNLKKYRGDVKRERSMGRALRYDVGTEFRAPVL